MSEKTNQEWDIVISSDNSFLNLKLAEVYQYRDLLWLFVKREVVTVYKQTILGPLWYIIQPILTTLMFTLIFSNIANISTDGIPPVLFYLLGVSIWSYFSESLTKTSNTFVANQHVFGKVYFPRVTVPASIVISNILKLVIQFFIFLIFWAYFLSKGLITFNSAALLFPLIILILAMLSFGMGMIFSAMTTKYRDLQFLLVFAIQLWMYVTPIIYPVSSIPENYLGFIKLNPITPLVECMRYGFLGRGDFSWESLSYSLIFSIVTLVFGYIVFSRVEKSFMDTV